jgi:hypothetical protein
VKYSSKSEDRDIFYSIETYGDKHYIADMGMNKMCESHSMCQSEYCHLMDKVTGTMHCCK